MTLPKIDYVDYNDGSLESDENLLDIGFNHNQTKVYIATQKGRVLQLEVGDL